MDVPHVVLSGDDRSAPRIILRPSAADRSVRRLFGPHIRNVGPVSDAAMRRVLRGLRAAPELRSFRIWLVGSRVDPGKAESDIDIVLSPRPGTLPRDALIERALFHCRDYGLHGGAAACVIDPCFRLAGPTVVQAPLQPHVAISTVKLLSPRLADLVAGGCIRKCRRVGDFGIEFVRHAGDTDYYGKLPRADFDGSHWPYLRPAIEIRPADEGDTVFPEPMTPA